MKFTLVSVALLVGGPVLYTVTPWAQGVGSKLPAIELEDFALTPASSFDDFFGRAVLIEFFAYW